MNSTILQSVSLRDTGTAGNSAVHTYAECKPGYKMSDFYPGAFNKAYRDSNARKIHDSNFAFVMTELSKLHQKAYEPKYNTTYAQDIPIDVGGGMVDFVDYFSVEWAGMPTEAQNITGNNVNVIPRVNANLKHIAVEVYNFEIAYDIKFIEIDKLNKISFQKSIEAIYKDAIMAGWDMFADQIAYVGRNGQEGLLNNSKVLATTMPAGTGTPNADGISSMSDEEVVGLINGILGYYLTNTNSNFSLLPDTFLLPMDGASNLSSRFSALYTSTLREFLMTHNVGIDEAKAAGLGDYIIKLKGRARLNGAGAVGGGRIVAYKFDKDFVRIDIPYPVQVYYTAPNMERMCYTTFFVGQISQVQMPYNEDSDKFGAVSYWDLTPGI